MEPRAGTPLPARNHRYWIPLVIAGLAGAGMLYVRFSAELEHNFATWLVSVFTLLGLVLMFLWFLFLSGFRWKARLIALGVFLLAAGFLAKSVRVDGTLNGTGLPRFAWRWASPRSQLSVVSLPRLPAQAPLGAKTVPGIVDVPQFFGPNRDGIIQGAHLSRDWKTAPPRELWRQPIGAGWSAFAVVGDRAYTEEQRGETECVSCYEVLTGKLLWLHSNASHFSQWQSGDGPHATPTVVEGEVISMGATGLLNCLDAATGQPRWSRNVLAENNLPNLTWGVSDSPLVFEHTIVVTGGQTAGPTVLAYNRDDGKPQWSAGKDKASYASPLLATLAGRRVVLSCNAASLTAHDPATGEILLDFPWTTDKWPKASQPVVIGTNEVFLSAGYGSGCQLLDITQGADHKLSARTVWRNLHMKTQFNSAALRGGYLYGLDDGMLACVELASGNRVWKDGRYGSGPTLLVDDLILIQSEQGDVALAEAKPDAFVELGRIPALHGKTWNNPTLAGRYLLVRNSEEAVCYELPTENKAMTSR
jgi:outer membrane protein assembly factor BamB